MQSTENCFICETSLSCGDEPINKVKSKGLKTLIKFSIKRQDGKHVFLRKLSCILVHANCRKTYTKERSDKTFLLDATTKKALASDSQRNRQAIDFKSKCFFCDKSATDTKQSRSNNVHYVSKKSMKESILEIAEKKDIKWYREIAFRIKTVDLLAVQARYHNSCIKKFYRARKGAKRGRPECTKIMMAMKHAYNFLENNIEECQFSIDEIFQDFEGELPTQKTIECKLLEKYGDDIIINKTSFNKTIVCFRNTGHNILTQQWYTDQKSDMNGERLRIVKAAAEIICEDIRMKAYNTEHYPQPEYFLKNLEEDIPESLDLLLKTIVLKNKRGSVNKYNTKCTAIAHSVIAATRPNSFVSGLQVGLSSYINQKYGSKQLIGILSTLGFCASYNEAALFESSAILNQPTLVIDKSFSQFVFDNADVNTCTIDGFNTFHAMGGIQCVTPGTAVSCGEKIIRLKRLPSAKLIGYFGQVPIKVFNRADSSGLLNIEIKDINNIHPISKDISSSITDFLWLYGKFQSISDIPGWNGFMERATADLNYDTSRIICPPFTNAPPSDYDTIYTVLITASDKCMLAKQKTCYVTFDQPLYIKARDIIASSSADDRLNNVVIRLGGFHLHMSFMGAIGYIMNGSGLKDVFNIVYASASVEKMLSGHAYARALRAHILTHLALAKIILNATNFIESEHSILEILLKSQDKSSFLSESESEIFQELLSKFNNSMNKLCDNGPTAQLWIQYFRMVTLIKQFIEAERSGNWTLHLDTIQKMIPFFHASGHFLYAKSCHLYLQDMFSLQDKLDHNEYALFVTKGYFTIRRSDKFWSGIWSDMTIEQTLMRSMKTCGGLTHGRGISDSTLSKWIISMPILSSVSEAIENYCRISTHTTDQHVDSRNTRVSRDNADTQKFSDWFSSHPPFPVTNDIMSISNGIVGDSEVNCQDAYKNGTFAMSALVGNFGNIHFKRKNRVSPIGAMNLVLK